jgi:F-type H+-transporting ATPase subunit b
MADANTTTTGSGSSGTIAATAVPPAAQESHSFPPFDPTTFAPQLFWLAITFIGLYVLLSRMALPRISTVLTERKNRIEGDLQEAERLKGETDTALKAYEKALSDARKRAGGIAREVRDTLKSETDAERARAGKIARDSMADAEARIAAAKAQALGNVSTIASDTASEIVRQLIGIDVPPGEVDAAVRASSTS